MNLSDIVGSWQKDEPIYKDLGAFVSGYIQKEIPLKGIYPQVSYRTKELYSIIKKLKRKNKEKPYTYADVKDKLGIRIVCDFQEDLVTVDEFLKGNFVVQKVEYKQELIRFNTLDYISNHYDIKLKEGIEYEVEFSKYQNLTMEVQVRTLNQHAWANSAHLLSYKLDEDLPPKTARRIYRLLSLYEIADDELSAVNGAIMGLADNSVVVILKKLEKWFYSFARIEYNRDLAIDNIRILLSFLDASNHKILQAEMERFLKDNARKISKIFDENRERFFEVDFLTQPEILLAWYILDTSEFNLVDNWGNHFDIEDLNSIRALWGVDLMD